MAANSSHPCLFCRTEQSEFWNVKQLQTEPTRTVQEAQTVLTECTSLFLLFHSLRVTGLRNKVSEEKRHHKSP